MKKNLFLILVFTIMGLSSCSESDKPSDLINSTNKFVEEKWVTINGGFSPKLKYDRACIAIPKTCRNLGHVQISESIIAHLFENDDPEKADIHFFRGLDEMDIPILTVNYSKELGPNQIDRGIAVYGLGTVINVSTVETPGGRSMGYRYDIANPSDWKAGSIIDPGFNIM